MEKNSDLAFHYVLLDLKRQFCGEVFYQKDPEHKRAGLDIKFLPEAQGKGLATEALKLLIEYIFETEEEIDAVWTEPSKENRAARALYTRCGLVEKERPADMEPAESYWELKKEDWRRAI